MSSKVKKAIKFSVPLLIIVGAVMAAGAITSMKPEPKKKEEKVKVPLVEVMKVDRGDLRIQLDSYGVVKPKNQTSLVAEVSGRILKLSDAFVSGGFVNQGDLLVQIDPSDYQANLIEAEASLARARAALEQEIARGKVAEAEWRGATSKLPPELGLRKPQLAQEKANVRSAEAALARAKRNLERTEIRAPYDALINKRQVDLGQYVSLGAPVGLVSSTSTAEIRLPVSSSDLAFIQDISQSPADATLTARDGALQQQWPARIVRSEGVVDEASRMVYLVAEVINPYQLQPQLKFGTFVSADIAGEQQSQVTVLPSHLYKNGQVAVINADRQLELRDVTLLRRDETRVYISDGLRHGELLSLTKLENQVNGMQVRLPGEAPATDTDSGDAQLASVGE